MFCFTYIIVTTLRERDDDDDDDVDDDNNNNNNNNNNGVKWDYGCWNLKVKFKQNDTSINSGTWHHLKIIQNVPEQHNGKVRKLGTTEITHIGHCTRTSESANVEIQSI